MVRLGFIQSVTCVCHWTLRVQSLFGLYFVIGNILVIMLQKLIEENAKHLKL